MSRFNEHCYAESSTKITASIKRETEKAILLEVTFWTTTSTPEKKGQMWAPKSCATDNGDGTFNISWPKVINQFIDNLNANKGQYCKLCPNFDMDDYYRRKASEEHSKEMYKEIKKSVKASVKDTFTTILLEAVYNFIIEQVYYWQEIAASTKARNIFSDDITTKINSACQDFLALVPKKLLKNFDHSKFANKRYFFDEKRFSELAATGLNSEKSLNDLSWSLKNYFNDSSYFNVASLLDNAKINDIFKSILENIKSELNIPNYAGSDYKMLDSEVSSAKSNLYIFAATTKASKIYGSFHKALVNNLHSLMIGWTEDDVKWVNEKF